MSTADPRNNGEPVPARLPGVEGFYFLRKSGELGRYRPDGRFNPEPELSEALADTVRAMLRRYRAGDVDDLAIGLVTADIPDRPWRSASLVFSDHMLREVFKTGDDSDEHLTNFQKRNSVRSLFQGMEYVLEAWEPSQPEYPRYCPVLYSPETDGRELARRYGLDDVDPGRVLELLDLTASLAPEQRHHRLFSRMVLDVIQSRIAPEMRSDPELTVAAGASPEIRDFRQYGESPWPEEAEHRRVEFNAGDTMPYWLLASFSPFNQLNDLQRQFIGRGLVISKTPAGTVFVQRGSEEDISVYLIEGTIVLEAFDGRTISIIGGTKRAQLPISQLRPHAYTVRAETDVTVFLASQTMIRKVTRITTTYRNRPGIDVREVGLLSDDVEDPLPDSSSGSGTRR